MKAMLRKDAVRLAILSVVLVIIMKVLFHAEQLSVLIRVTASLLWLYILPGFVIMYAWHKRLEFLHRIIIGTAAGFAIISTASYYLGMMGMHVKHHALVLPPLVILGFMAYFVYAHGKTMNEHQKSPI